VGRIYDATWGRAFAALYDRGLRATEQAGLLRMRRELLAQAEGRTIDLGAGTGINLDLFPEAVSELVMTEPDPHMLKQLRTKAAGRGGVEIKQASAQELPFADGSFDTAVFALVLCTVPDPASALREAARVLRPGGKLLFIEHGRLPKTPPIIRPLVSGVAVAP
jgi:ubiquinone/menaquinone biosynthesis C-methylase UbiE